MEPLVGRHSELERIDAVLAARDRLPGGIVLEGRAGIGKTALWREALRRSSDMGYRVLDCALTRSESRLAFAGLADLIGPVLDEVLPGLAPPQAHALKAALAMASDGAVARDEGAVAFGLHGALSALASRSPIAIAVDDIGWLDPSSALMLSYTIRRLRREPVLLVFAKRTGEGLDAPDSSLDATGVDLERIVVGPLPLGAIHRLLRTRLGASLTRPQLLRIHKASAGNPLHALELARALDAEGNSGPDLRRTLRRRPFPVGRSRCPWARPGWTSGCGRLMFSPGSGPALRVRTPRRCARTLRRRSMSGRPRCIETEEGSLMAARTVHLADGRTLAFEKTGDAAGTPVFLAHGFPGSRLEARVVGDAAREAGVQLVCPDRPGFGESDPHEGRQLGDWPADVAALADSLGFSRFAVLGFSGGGPFAVACAAGLGSRVSACGLVSSPGPLDRAGTTAGMSLLNRAIFGGGRRAPIVANLLLRLIARSAGAEPAVVAQRLGQGMAPADRRTLSDPAVAQAYGQAVREAFRQGPAGAVVEASLLVRPWPFAPESIGITTLIWHGDQDRNVPVGHARRLSDRMVGSRLQVVEGAGHLLFFEHAATIFAEMRIAAATSVDARG